MATSRRHQPHRHLPDVPRAAAVAEATAAGRIINFSSGPTFPGVAGQTHYVAAKAGIVGFTRSLAREVRDYRITVNSITPGLTVTKAVRDNFPGAILQAQRDGRARHRDEAPEDLVGPTFFLASEDAAFITGQTLNVDDGISMHRTLLGVHTPTPSVRHLNMRRT